MDLEDIPIGSGNGLLNHEGETLRWVRPPHPPPMIIDFKRLTVEDLDLLFRWLNTPHVVEWYGKKKFTPDEVKNQYLPRINGTEPTKSYIIVLDNIQIGYIQEYFVRDDLEMLKYIDKNSAGIDLFIGKTDYLGKGLGEKIIREFLQKIVFIENGVTTCIVDPLLSNPRMIHVNEKVGFEYFQTTKENNPRYLMKISKQKMLI